MIIKSWGKILGVGSLFLVILYFLKGIIFTALFVGIIPIIIIFLVSVALKYFAKNPKFKNKSIKELLITSIGLGASIGLIMFLVVKIFKLR